MSAVTNFLIQTDDDEDSGVENADLHSLAECARKIHTAQQLIQLLKARLLVVKSVNSNNNNKRGLSTLTGGGGNLPDNVTADTVVEQLFKIVEAGRRSELAIKRGIQFSAFNKLCRDTNNLKNNADLLTSLLDKTTKSLAHQGDLVSTAVDDANKLIANKLDVRAKMVKYLHDKSIDDANENGAVDEEDDVKKKDSLTRKKIKTINRMACIMKALPPVSNINWLDTENKALLDIVTKWRTPCTVENICKKYDIPENIVRKVYEGNIAAVGDSG